MEYFPLPGNCLLFKQVSEKELPLLLSCLQPRKANFAKDATLIHEGDTVKEVGIILSGSLQIVRNDFWGNKTLVSRFSVGDLFGETLACSGEPSQIRAIAEVDLQVLFLDVKKIITSCSNNCVFHTKLIENMVTILAEKNQMLMKKMAHITKRSTREKLLSYLSEESIKANNQSFVIPFDRQQLADYLCVERSAMSNELSKMRFEGLLDYHKNGFTLKEIENNE
ncbi:Crp/Fnr family transcriptional regulator [uncultured Sphaerochaeta sp.]|uniref:Crp/Fnr family transcriptional regulator n=1 Tax=uncultured Sphaerochaeta sp. TaxID=886478 RepID=UPI002A0A93F4|nr:Crp/Fnr family transcriptional regulator [uncultured Sphaerochaeta sp.]